MHDPFNPFGAYDPLQSANLAAHTAHMTGEPELYQCLELVTNHLAAPSATPRTSRPARRRSGRRGYPARAGGRGQPAAAAAFKAGRRVVHTKIEQVWD
ncbi:MAG: hypothetical protein R3A44_12865 [Caldilineaceae bacterium]